MTDSLQIAFVCEGPTDSPILEAVVEAILGADYVPLYLQPERDMLSDGESWGDGNDDRVRAWCEQRAGNLEYAVYGADVIIVQLDADRCAKYGASSTAELCATVKGWLGASASDARLVIVLPAQATESWLVAAHGALSPQLERVRHPEERLAALGKLERDHDGRAIKSRQRYVSLAERLREELPRVRGVLDELERFASKLERHRERLAS